MRGRIRKPIKDEEMKGNTLPLETNNTACATSFSYSQQRWSSARPEVADTQKQMETHITCGTGACWGSCNPSQKILVIGVSRDFAGVCPKPTLKAWLTLKLDTNSKLMSVAQGLAQQSLISKDENHTFFFFFFCCFNILSASVWVFPPNI